MSRMHQPEVMKSRPSDKPGARRGTRPLAAPVSEHDRWMRLQQGIGNQAVSRMLHKQIAATGAAAGTSAETQTAGAKLRIGEPGDAYEHEADRVADQVMSASPRSLVGNASAGDRRVGTVPVPASVNVRRPGGSFFDPRLIGARAYALGNDVVLGENVDVGSAEGERILIHELVHVEQAKVRGDSTVRRWFFADLKTQSIGPDYAQQLTDTKLEQDIVFLMQYRAGLKPDSIDYRVASDNLRVLSEEADRRGYKSPALVREPLIAMFKAVLSEIKRVVEFLPHFKAEFKGVSWSIPWDRDRKAWTSDPMIFIDQQFNWMVDALSAAAEMIKLSFETDHDVSLALLQQAGVRISSVILGFSALRPFLYFVQAAIAVRMNGPWMDPQLIGRPADNVRIRITPDLAAFARLEAESLEAVAASSIAKTEALFGELQNYVKQFTPLFHFELPWQAEVALIVVSALLEIPGGVFAGEAGAFTLSIRGGMMSAFVGGRVGAGMVAITISAEQIAALRRLVAIGAISPVVVSAATGLSLATRLDVPQALTDLIGEGPTAKSMHATGKTGAGLARKPRHHVMPQEERPWFEERGMTGDLDIDQFTVDMEEAAHQAIHGGGNWRLGREWPGNWNAHIMQVLREAEAQLGRRLNPSQILNVVGREMRRYGIPMNFVPFR